jgi:hypothetical protein
VSAAPALAGKPSGFYIVDDRNEVMTVPAYQVRAHADLYAKVLNASTCRRSYAVVEHVA